MKILLITGPIGGGKSKLCRMLQKHGVPVYDCDEQTKSIYQRHPSLLTEMEKVLGCTLRNEQGELDKAVLANLIFADDKARAKVNALVHPQVVEDFHQWAVGQSTAWVAIESALFLSPQAGARLDADAVIYVDAPESLRIQRILSRRGATLEQAQARVAAQDISPKDARVSHVLVNDGTEEKLELQLNQILQSLSI